MRRCFRPAPEWGYNATMTFLTTALLCTALVTALLLAAVRAFGGGGDVRVGAGGAAVSEAGVSGFRFETLSGTPCAAATTSGRVGRGAACERPDGGRGGVSEDASDAVCLRSPSMGELLSNSEAEGVASRLGLMSRGHTPSDLCLAAKPSSPIEGERRRRRCVGNYFPVFRRLLGSISAVASSLSATR